MDFRDLKRLRLSSTNWHHLELLTKVLREFKNATDYLSQTDEPQIHNIWLMYNRLFDFLDDMVSGLGEDSESTEGQGLDWPAVVKKAAKNGEEKLRKYYSKMSEQRGYLFNCVTILDPTQKLTAYEVRLSQIFNTAFF